MLSLKSVQLCLVRCENNKKNLKTEIYYRMETKNKIGPRKKYNFDFLNERLIKKTKYEFT